MQTYERDMRSWSGATGMKALIDAKGPCFQYKDSGSDYSIWFDEGPTRYYCVIKYSDTADKTEFDNGYASGANRAVPIRMEPFAANVVEFAGNASVAHACPASTTTDIDLKLTEELLLNGGIIYEENATIDDWIEAQVIDRDGEVYPAGTVLKVWINKWGVVPGHLMDLATAQAGVVPDKMVLRVKYTAGSGSERKVTVNYKLNRKL